ncbi:hypothetical protein AVEN_232269-1 [Araneus ventricosus]|uniref:Uncharacterized protein n=1 Tax=Araneus ventricosus TaxID=182803 RepID=A0A4Y2GX80_ARAVE|nr:hypothetical protein AVEN_232269-1 [Araneus ventricosus]
MQRSANNLKRVTPDLSWHSGTLNDSRCNSFSTETGVLAAITSHGPIHPVEGTYYHWGEDNLIPTINISPVEVTTRSLMRLLNIGRTFLPRSHRKHVPPTLSSEVRSFYVLIGSTFLLRSHRRHVPSTSSLEARSFYVLIGSTFLLRSHWKYVFVVPSRDGEKRY